MRERLQVCLNLVVLAAAALFPWPDAARADVHPGAERSWPVSGGPGAPRPVLLRGWDPPPSPWAAGHRGVDLGTTPGAEVRAVAAGRVSYAGPVAGRGVVTVTLTGTGREPLRVTYEPVQASPSVEVGDVVQAGQVVGRVEEAGYHCARACLHWGLLRGEVYLDPLSLLPEWMRRTGPIRLLPHLGVPVPTGAAPRPALGFTPRAVAGRVYREARSAWCGTSQGGGSQLVPGGAARASPHSPPGV